MSQIMRLRRRAGADFEINDRNNGHRHEESFVTLVRDYGLLHEAELLPRSFGGNSWFGKFHPAAGAGAAQVAGGDRPGGPARQGQHQDRAPRTQDRQARPGRRQAGVQDGRGPPATLRAQPVREWLRGRSRARGVGPPRHRQHQERDPSPPRAKARRHEGCLLAGLREPRVHAGAARLDGQGRAAARPGAGRARPRRLLRRRRHRRAQPGAGRHAQRPHLRAGPADRRRADDEHLLHLPGRAVRVPGAPGRQHRVSRSHQPEPRRRGPEL